MKVIWDKVPRPRLLSSAVTSTALPPKPKPPSPPQVPSIAAGTGTLRFGLLTLGAAAAVAGLIVLAEHHFRSGSPKETKSLQLVDVTTHGLAAQPETAQTPFPLVVELSPEMLQVTAIALGHPRIAVINGRMVTEGDSIVVHAPTHAVALTLRVVRITDGRVELFDGLHTVHAAFSPPSASPARR